MQFMGLQRARHNLATEQEQQNNISLPNKDLFILPRRMAMRYTSIRMAKMKKDYTMS